MRAIKPVCGLLLLVALATMWTQRDLVVDAYANGGLSSADVQLSGVDLDVTLSPIEESPYHVAPAPDTRMVPVTLPFAVEETTPPVTPTPEPSSDDPDAPAITTTTVAPTTISPPPINGGDGRLTGTVVGPDGPIPFATVRLERHTSEGFALLDLVTDSTGRWDAPRLLGGRYRVRAWAAGEFTMTESLVFFLADDEVKRADLTLIAVDLEPRMDLVDAGNIYLGLTGSVAVTVTVNTVDEEGRIVVAGLPGAIITFFPSAEVVASPSVAIADTDGVARFVLRCLSLGRPTVQVQHQEDVVSFALPRCVPEPPPPPPPTTTTTVPASEGSTASVPTTAAAPATTTTAAASEVNP